jgi:hypothetical protein
MKSKSKVFLWQLTVCLLLLTGAAANNASAQCILVTADAAGNIVASMTVSCDFPIYIEQADVNLAEQEYQERKTDWADNNPADYAAFQSMQISYIQIHQEDFDAMPAARQAKITSNPDYYHLIP